MIWLIFTLAAHGAVPGAAPPYRADHTDPKTIRIWGDPGLADLAAIWEAGYQRQHPGIRFENRLINTAMGMPGIYLGLADLAFLGREANVTDRDGFAHVRAYAPLRLEIATGSLATPGKSFAPVVFVARSNPIPGLTLAQLAGTFGSDAHHPDGRLRTWGDLGLDGAWAARPVHLYLFDIDSGTGQFFLHAVLGDSRKLAWDRLTECRDESQILEALGKDPDGLAVAGLAWAGPAVRPLPLAAAPGSPLVVATPETLVNRTYPLTRFALAFVNRRPGHAVDPKVAEFLRYLYGPEGQAGIAREGAFLPLDSGALAKQRRALGP